MRTGNLCAGLCVCPFLCPATDVIHHSLSVQFLTIDTLREQKFFGASVILDEIYTKCNSPLCEEWGVQREAWIRTPSPVSDFDLQTYLSRVYSQFEEFLSSLPERDRGRWAEKALQLFSLEWSAARCLLESPPAFSTPTQTPPGRFSWEVQPAERARVTCLPAPDEFSRSQLY